MMDLHSNSGKFLDGVNQSRATTGTVTIINKEHQTGFVTCDKGYIFKFDLKDAAEDVRVGSRVSFHLLAASNCRQQGLADHVVVEATII